MPLRRVVLYIEITDVKRMNCWWLVAENGAVDLCLDDPGHEVDVSRYTDLLTLTQIYIGDRTLERASARWARSSSMVCGSLSQPCRGWFARSKFADDNPRPAAIRAAV
ncbi:MAG: hypothetical protein ACREV2_11410 [Burkholderiales bacterium]